MPSWQMVELNRLIGLMIAVNRRLGPFVMLVNEQVEKLGLQLALLSSFSLWHIAAGTMFEFIDCMPTAKEFSAQRTAAQEAYESGPVALVGYLPGLKTGKATEIDEVVATRKKELREGIEEQWRHVGAIGLQIELVAREFGEDPAPPELREMLDTSREALQELHRQAMCYMAPFDLPEPTDADLQQVEEIFNA